MKANVTAFTLALLLLNFQYLPAQKRNHQLAFIVEAGFPSKYFETGGGGFIKGAYGINRNAQLTLQTGMSKFKSYASIYDQYGREPSRITIRFIPVLIGYKQYLKQFYLEPQVGYGEEGGKIVDVARVFTLPSNGSFYWAIGAGYQFHKLDLGIRYQRANTLDKDYVDLWGDNQFSFVGLHIGYTLNLN